MSVGYNLGCLDCLEEVDAVSSSLAGNSCGADLQSTLDFIVIHHGHRLVSFTDDEVLNKETGKIEFVY